MPSTELSRDNGYQIPPSANADRGLFQSVFTDVDARLVALEALQVSYEATVEQLTTQALNVITQTISAEIDLQRATLDQIQMDAQAVLAAYEEISLTGVPALQIRLNPTPQFAPINVQAGFDNVVPRVRSLEEFMPTAALRDSTYTRDQANDRYYTKSESDSRYPSQQEIENARWPLSKLQLSTGPNVLGRMQGEGAPQFLTPENLMLMLAPILAGEYVFLPSGVIPAGKRIIKANGATLVRADYPHLFAYAQNSGYMSPTEATKTAASFGPGNGSTTFTIPDARGYFLRAFDDGRGIDVGRVISAIQASAMHQHSHTLPMGFGGATIYTWLDANNAPVFGSEVQGGTSNAEYAAASTGGGRNSRLAWSSGVERQSGETRPINLAATLGIRY